MQSTRERLSKYQFQSLTNVAFSFYSTEEIKKMARIDVSLSLSTGDKVGTVKDPQFGPLTPKEACETCSQTWVDCPGHYGKIKLPEPLIHPLGRKYVIAVLNCICTDCGDLLLSEDFLRSHNVYSYEGIDRLNKIRDLSSSTDMVCDRSRPCAIQNADKEKDIPCGPRCIYTDRKKGDKKTDRKDSVEAYKIFRHPKGKEGSSTDMTPQKIKEILDGISDATAIKLGFNGTLGTHPSNMIVEYIIVPPLNVRPDMVDGDKRMFHDLTSLTQEIVRQVNSYKTVKPSTQRAPAKGEKKDTSEKQETKADPMRDSMMSGIYNSVLQYWTATTSSRATSGKAKRSITELIQGKKGLVREHIMSKRVDFAGRTVLGPGHRLRVDEIGIPKVIAKILTRPIRAWAYNIDELQAEYDAGRVRHIVINEQRRPIDDNFRAKNPKYKIKAGNIVFRCLKDGDCVYFNRQPTLKRQNMLALKVRLHDELILKINISNAPPQDADFDGDEGNIYVPQTEEAYQEMVELLSVQNQIIDGRESRNIIALNYDSVLGVYLMTAPDKAVMKDGKKDLKNMKDYAFLPETPDIEIDEDMYSYVISPMIESFGDDFFSKIDLIYEKLLRYNVPKRSGRGIFSLALPSGFYYLNEKDKKNPIEIKDGVLIRGQLSSKHLGKNDGGIIVQMRNKIGDDKTIDFLSWIQFLSNHFMNIEGFSIGLTDLFPHMKEVITDEKDPNYGKSKYLVEIDADIKKLSETIAGMDKPTNRFLEAQYEKSVAEKLASFDNRAGKRAEQLIPKDNALSLAASSGAKGQMFNIIQITTALGQQRSEGLRIEKSFPGDRTLPTFPYGCDSLESRGFCRSSFSEGLKPVELYFHMRATRENLIDTSQSTASAGMLSHKIVKTLEDVSISQEGFVANASTYIIQSVYGGDGYNPQNLETIEVEGRKYMVPRNLQQLAYGINQRYEYY